MHRSAVVHSEASEMFENHKEIDGHVNDLNFKKKQIKRHRCVLESAREVCEVPCATTVSSGTHSLLS